MLVPDAGWRTAVRRDTKNGTQYTRILDFDKYVDTIIAVFDPASGRQVSSLRLPQMAPYLAEAGSLVAGLTTKAGDRMVLKHWKLALQGQ
jgi:hypothetical protein